MILMDKMKEHSCAIQPAFGYGGGGGGGAMGMNFALMFEQVLNADVPPVDDEDTSDPPLYVPQAGGFLTPANQIQQSLAPMVAAFHQALITVNEQHDAVPEGTQQPQLSITELVSNAVQQHIATHHPPQNGTAAAPNNAQESEINISEMISNALQEQFGTPPEPLTGTTGILTNAFQLQLSENGGHIQVSDQPLINTAGLLQNPFLNDLIPPALITAEMGTFQYIAPPIPQLVPAHGPGGTSVTPLTSMVYNTVTPDDESNTSSPPFYAPVSSPNHFYSSSDNVSDDEDYIIVIDNAGNPGSTNNPNTTDNPDTTDNPNATDEN